MAAGLEQVLTYLDTFHFSEHDLDWLERTGTFTPSTLAALHPCGSPAMCMPCRKARSFPHEPILRITAPLPEAQLVETRVMNLLNFQTMVASKACRSSWPPGTPLIDFGLRRAHGARKRNCWPRELPCRIRRYVQRPGRSEVRHSRSAQWPIRLYRPIRKKRRRSCIAQAHPRHVVLLIDTYDTEAAAERWSPWHPDFMVRALRSTGAAR